MKHTGQYYNGNPHLLVTKNKEKVDNITAAIETFEEWLGKNAPDSAKSAKPSEETKADTVPGLGFKNEEAARQTLK